MKKQKLDEICIHCRQWIYIDQEGDWVHRNPKHKTGDWRFCNESSISSIAEPSVKQAVKR